MKRLFGTEVSRVFAVLVVLLCAKGIQLAGWTPDGGTTLIDTLSSRLLNREAREMMTAGYYESLINESSRVSSMNRLVTGNRRITFQDRSQPDRRATHDFLFYEQIPNSDLPDYLDERQRYRRKTNSVGMTDREYTLVKPEGVRRIALMGDSVTRGQGAPFQENYESFLERKLNEDVVGSSIKGVEILNFAVGSYNATQMMEAAKVKATPYNPDVYVIALSKLSVYRQWGQHIALLMNAGIDLKYDYLKTMAREAGLNPTDPIGVFDAKMARVRIPTIKWILSELQAHATSHDAKLVVLLIPVAEPAKWVNEDFLGVAEMIRDLGIPVVDLLDAFPDGDLPTLRVAANDTHPNAEGHRRLFELLYKRIKADPEVTQILLGPNRDQGPQQATE
ncbi:MAG: SGNH/GDSL hydrolase family protein [Acidobacteria bacterium]|nr:SGNH/GDSL hydrolase family protein [Acidobacteriota bacterium]